jgi:hypothetical protein
MRLPVAAATEMRHGRPPDGTTRLWYPSEPTQPQRWVETDRACQVEILGRQARTFGIHGLEAWNEAACGGAWGNRLARVGERIRRELDLEHWAAFGTSFGQFEQLLTGLATGTHGRPPASVSVLGGDIHHSYLAAVDFPGARPRSAVYQAVCSPIHNVLPDRFRRGHQLTTSRPGSVAGRGSARLAGVRRPRIRWRITRGSWFHNMLSVLEFDGRQARIRFDRTVSDQSGIPHLQPVCEAELS